MELENLRAKKEIKQRLRGWSLLESERERDETKLRRPQEKLRLQQQKQQRQQQQQKQQQEQELCLELQQQEGELRLRQHERALEIERILKTTKIKSAWKLNWQKEVKEHPVPQTTWKLLDQDTS